MEYNRISEPDEARKKQPKTNIPFYLVWGEGANAPRVEHPTIESAKAEAERLATINPGRAFYVLAPLSKVRTSYDLQTVTFSEGCSCQKK